MVTIEDIAAQAGVSCTTVTNVIHNRTNRVSRETTEKIRALINELGYVPNMSARALAAGSSKVVAMVNHLNPVRSGNIMGDPFFTAFAGSVEEALKKSGYYFMLRSVSGKKDLLKFLAGWNINGLFFNGVFEDDDIYSALTGLDIPVVLSDSYLSDYGNMSNIGLEDYNGGYLAAKHLTDNGHKRIAFACPPMKEGGVVEQRFLGFCRALNDAGLEFNRDLMFESEFSTHTTMNLGEEIAGRNDVTAVFATADIMAAGIMAGIRRAGKSVPADFSIVGFDDINWCRLLNPALTTIHQDMEVKGELAAEQMTKRLRGKEILEPKIILPVRLRSRDSVSRLN
ncbi:LacI family transcriptional regulator [Clostridia bacterium]|nr:LacI family transcriptional regulator [Clostridia bacterium]